MNIDLDDELAIIFELKHFNYPDDNKIVLKKSGFIKTHFDGEDVRKDRIYTII